MMKTLMLMRHAHAASNNPAWSDHERPLTDHGRQLATATGKLLAECPPDCIVYSTATRTTETAQLIAAQCPSPPAMSAQQNLYLASSAAYLDAAVELGAAGHQAVMVVGHNPGIASLVNRWSRESLAFMPATVAILELNVNDWQELRSGGRFHPELTGYISEGLRHR
ncbi:MAG: histidine phosphatase family protein [Fuerstiella sp.]